MDDNIENVTIAPGDGAQLIFVTEDRGAAGRLATWLVRHEQSTLNNLEGLTERDITMLDAFLNHARIRLDDEKTRRARARIEAELRACGALPKDQGAE